MKKVFVLCLSIGISFVLGCDQSNDPCSPEPDPMTDACLTIRTQVCAKLAPDTCGSITYCFPIQGRRIISAAAGDCVEPKKPVECIARGSIAYPASGIAMSPTGEKWYFTGRPFPTGWTEVPNTVGIYPECP